MRTPRPIGTKILLRSKRGKRKWFRRKLKGELKNEIHISRKCSRCELTESARWWKCCSKHTSERLDDVLCNECVEELHIM